MTTKKLQVAMYAVIGLGLSSGVALADVGQAMVTQLLAPSANDLAPTTGDPPRLKRTDQNQPGAEMSHLTFFGDNVHGLYFEMRSGDLCGGTGGIGGTASTPGCFSPNDKIQLAAVPFHLAQNPADGSVSAVGDLAGSSFVTNNRGNERRNANHPVAYTIANGNVACVQYNYQPNNGNNTKRYMQCFDSAGHNVMAQTEIYAKNNDDCSMNQDQNNTTVVSHKIVAGKSVTKLVGWFGCNGNGQDDGWLMASTVTCDSETAATTCTFKQQMDVSLCQQEERSRGFCSVGTDPDTAICSWTEGNNQPQRDGVWIAAVNIADTVTGNDQDGAVLWKQQVDGRHGDGDLRTYSMRAMHERIQTVDSTGRLVPTDDIIWRHGASHGNNNGNNGKGGTYFGNMMAVMTVTKEGLVYKSPLTDMQDKLMGLDGTHLGMGFAMFGTTDHVTPGVVFVGGSQTGGGYPSKIRAVGFDSTTNSINDLGSYSIAPYDRHLYSNYLGNNPGNQGRNFSGSVMVANPFVGQNNKDAYLMVMTTTGKAAADMIDPSKKLSSFITVLPLAQTPADNTGSGSSTGSNTGSNTGSGDNGSGSNTTLGGCSTTGGSTGGVMTLLLVGVAATIRRRRRTSN